MVEKANQVLLVIEYLKEWIIEVLKKLSLVSPAIGLIIGCSIFVKYVIPFLKDEDKKE